MAIGKAPAVEGLVPRELYTVADRSDNVLATDVPEPAIVNLLRREGYCEDLNLGEGEHARLLLVLHASMREVEIAPMEDEGEEASAQRVEEQENTESDKPVELVGSSI